MARLKESARKSTHDIPFIRRSRQQRSRTPEPSTRRVQTRSVTRRTLENLITQFGEAELEQHSNDQHENESQPRTVEELENEKGEAELEQHSNEQPEPESQPRTVEEPDQNENGEAEVEQHSNEQPEPESEPRTAEAPENENGEAEVEQHSNDQPEPESQPRTVEEPDQNENGEAEVEQHSNEQPEPESEPRTAEAPENENGEAEVEQHSNDQPEPESEQHSNGEEEDEIRQAIINWDNGQRRVGLKHKLSMSYPDDNVRENEEDEDDDEGQEERSTDSEDEIPLDQLLIVRKRKREAAGDEKGKKVKKVRGPRKPRGAAALEKRPMLKVVGDGEFEATPTCNKLHATIRMLLFKHITIPVRSYNLFPTQVRSTVLKEFLKIYRWEPGQSRRRCIDVFESVAYDVFRSSLTRLREKLTKTVGESPSLWKAHPPEWCRNKVSLWETLCDLYDTEGWQGLRKTNTSNKAKDGGVAHHVAGSSSTHRVRKKVEKEKGSSDVSLMEVFDRMHKRKTPDGSVYCNAKAQQVADKYLLLSSKPETKNVEEMKIWKEAGGEAKGRIYGFGYRSISRECPQSSMHYKTTPIKTTTTGASKEGRYVTAGELEKVLAERDKQHAAELAKRDAVIQKLLAERDKM